MLPLPPSTLVARVVKRQGDAPELAQRRRVVEIARFLHIRTVVLPGPSSPPFNLLRVWLSESTHYSTVWLSSNNFFEISTLLPWFRTRSGSNWLRSANEDPSITNVRTSPNPLRPTARSVATVVEKPSAHAEQSTPVLRPPKRLMITRSPLHRAPSERHLRSRSPHPDGFKGMSGRRMTQSTYVKTLKHSGHSGFSWTHR
jgi:hypothetical protein